MLNSQNRLLLDPASAPLEGGAPPVAAPVVAPVVNTPPAAPPANIIDLSAERAQLAADRAAIAMEREQIRTRMAALQAAAPTPGTAVDLNALVEQTTTAVTNQLNAANQEQQRLLSTRLQALTDELAATKLAELRNRLITEAGGENALIVALVSGTNEAELRASIAASAAQYKKIVDTARGSTTQTLPAAGSPPASTAGNQGAGAGTDGDLLEGVKNLSPEQYAAKRTDIQAAMQKRYGGTNVPRRRH